MLKIALPKGRLGQRVYERFEAAGYACPELLSDSRKLIFEKDGYSFMTVKPSDVPTYVARGAADVGVAGADTVLETGEDVYELCDLKTGICRMAVCGARHALADTGMPLKVATKFPHIAERYFAGKNRRIDIIKLSGSIELAAVIGLSDVIVDLVETGKTLQENNLEVLETITEISARLIANKSSYQFMRGEMDALARKIGGIDV